MKRFIVTTICTLAYGFVFAQTKPNTEKAKDTVKTEVVEVVSSYAPKVTDAFKIKRKPVIELSKKVQRKPLDYKIKSVPVVSTYIPKSGVLKGIDIGDRERLFNNYVALGFGNNTTPFVEGYFHNNSAFEYEYGGKINFISSTDPVSDTRLNSGYYNASVDLFLKQEMRYYDWTAGFNAYRNKYNFYGLPENINFIDPTVNSIDPSQTHKFYNIFGAVHFPDRDLQEIKGSVAYFSDTYESDELHADIDALFEFPLGRFGLNLDDLKLATSINFINGGFARTYNDPLVETNYGFATAGINPSYSFSFKKFDVKLGGKAYYSFDLENTEGKFFAYPDIEINHPIIKRYANIYGGITGDLEVNSYQGFTSRNPYVSPTLNITQSSEALNVYGGFRGILSGNINYDVKAGFKKEENKALFLANPSNSNGTTNSFPGGVFFKGYDYGNSFGVVYDDVNTIYFSGGITYDYSRHLNLGMNLEFNNYDLSTQAEAWNLPQLKSDVFATYKKKDWYASANLYFVGGRKGTTYISGTPSVIDLDAYIDLNLDGGYHINDLFSVFLRANNITNSNYQTFNNFNAQGIQVLGGIIYKFDALF